MTDLISGDTLAPNGSVDTAVLLALCAVLRDGEADVAAVAAALATDPEVAQHPSSTARDRARRVCLLGLRRSQGCAQGSGVRVRALRQCECSESL